MKTRQQRWAPWAAVLVLNVALAPAAWPAGKASPVAFVADGKVYRGEFNLADKALSVAIDGLTYRGYYAARGEDAGASAPGGATGQWGRAFLFASSAKVLQCQLKTGFPQVSGQCLDAEGRKFELKAMNPPWYCLAVPGIRWFCPE